MTQLILPTSKKRKERKEEEIAFAEALKQLSSKIGFKLSSRGWAYQLEGFGLITKDQFDLVQNAINALRKKGLLPIDFTADEQGRKFKGIEWPTEESTFEFLHKKTKEVLEAENYYTPDWWEDETYYIQMIVEKIDLVSLFYPVCAQYHIPIATSSGWASMLMRAGYAARFNYYERLGYKCVLLYCGDHDPAGLQISKYLRTNLEDLKNIHWSNGMKGYDPEDLIIERFGLNADFIQEHNLSWINNLITGSGRDLSNPLHPDYNKAYVKSYLGKYGARKCEANALVVAPLAAESLVRSAIEKYLESDAVKRFEIKQEDMEEEFRSYRRNSGIKHLLESALELAKKEIELEEE